MILSLSEKLSQGEILVKEFPSVVAKLHNSSALMEEFFVSVGKKSIVALAL